MTGGVKAGEGQEAAGEKLDNRVVPVMREGVALVQLLLFATLKKDLAGRYGHWPQAEIKRLAGCVVSDLFAAPPEDPAAASFAAEHRDLVEAELRRLPEACGDLLPLLTDGLRMQVMCDHQQGRNTLPTLLRARALGILQEERPLPLPSTFMLAVRRQGVEQGLLRPMAQAEPQE